MIASKKTVEVSENVEPQDEVLTFEGLQIKNDREWECVTEEDKTNYSWHLKEKYQGKADSIHLYSASFSYLQLYYY